MATTVKSRPNHYELLGITPDAGGDSISRAFAKATSLFRPQVFGGITDLCLAYETLRDPARRRAYDASLGLTAAPKVERPSLRPLSASFAKRPAFAAHPPLAPPTRESSSAPRPLEAPVELAPDPPAPEPYIAPLQRRPTFDERPPMEIGPNEWKRAGVALGGLAAVAVLFGAVAGWWSSSDVGASAPAKEAAQASPSSAASELPSAQPSPDLISAPASTTVQSIPDRPRLVIVPKVGADVVPERPSLAVAEEVIPEQQTAPTDSVAEDSLAPKAVPVPASVSTMPLPHRTVARTIDRIGYRCGSVASATPVEGTAGAYTVVCSSGQSFQAKPVNGRYRFRRLAN